MRDVEVLHHGHTAIEITGQPVVFGRGISGASMRAGDLSVVAFIAVRFGLDMPRYSGRRGPALQVAFQSIQLGWRAMSAAGCSRPPHACRRPPVTRLPAPRACVPAPGPKSCGAPGPWPRHPLPGAPVGRASAIGSGVAAGSPTAAAHEGRECRHCGQSLRSVGCRGLSRCHPGPARQRDESCRRSVLSSHGSVAHGGWLAPGLGGVGQWTCPGTADDMTGRHTGRCATGDGRSPGVGAGSGTLSACGEAGARGVAGSGEQAARSGRASWPTPRRGAPAVPPAIQYVSVFRGHG